MNTMQIATAVRLLVVFLGGIAVSKGLVSQEMVDHASDMTVVTQIVGGIAAAGAAIYGIWLRRPAGIVASAASVPGVSKITATPTIADAVPSSKVTAS